MEKQAAGIRQGCPLSPYLFLIVMTVMFHDIHADKLMDEQISEDRILGTLFDEVLYADDTIIHSTTPESVSKLLHKIETEGAKYGLKLNEKKCEALTIREERSTCQGLRATTCFEKHSIQHASSL